MGGRLNSALLAFVDPTLQLKDAEQWDNATTDAINPPEELELEELNDLIVGGRRRVNDKHITI